MWYGEEAATCRQFSLRARDEQVATTKIHALCEALRNPLLNRDIGRIYLAGADPSLATRTWQEMMNVYSEGGKKSSVERKEREFASDVYDPVRDLTLNETRADHFLAVLKAGGSSTNHYLRRIRNFARDMDWLLSNVIAKKVWPKIKHKVRNPVTAEQHAKIIAAEHNLERRNYYELVWMTGGSQTDIANLAAEDVDFVENKLVYYRQKKGEESMTCYMTMGPKMRQFLLTLPRQGPLVPKVTRENWKDRAAEFARRCRVCGIKGISLHSYRFS
jgi:integrase